MTTLEIILIIFVAGLLVLALVQTMVRSRERERLEVLTREAARQEALVESAEREREMQRGQLEHELQAMTERFESLSEVITRRRADELSAANKRDLGEILTPLRESLRELDLALKHSGEGDERRAGRMEGQIRSLIEQTQTVGQKADRLAEAMSASGKVQGDWGEMQLEQLLQREGFTRGVEYDTQVVLRRDSKILRPDFVLHFPDGRDVMADSKVSLRAYIRYVEAKDEEGRAAALADLERDLLAHLRELTDKRYHLLETAEGRRTFPYTLMFVPVTGALLLMSQTDLSARALAGGVLLVTPESLTLFLKIISEAWTAYRQEQSIAEVMQLAKKVLWQAENIRKDFELVGSKLADARQAYDNTLTHLTGRQGLVSYASQIRDRIG